MRHLSTRSTVIAISVLVAAAAAWSLATAAVPRPAFRIPSWISMRLTPTDKGIYFVESRMGERKLPRIGVKPGRWGTVSIGSGTPEPGGPMEHDVHLRFRITLDGDQPRLTYTAAAKGRTGCRFSGGERVAVEFEQWIQIPDGWHRESVDPSRLAADEPDQQD